MENTEEQNQEESSQDVAGSASARPVASFSGTGGLNVAVWKNKSENDREYYSVRLERSYKDDAGNYKSTSYLRDGDLLRSGKLLEAADEWIEQDKAKSRAGVANRGR